MKFTEEEIDDKIDEWHNGNTGVELHEYLGMTLEEYALFVTDPDAYFEK